MDLDALMARVREAAMGTGASGSAAAPAPCDAAGHDSISIRVIDAQGEWNEHTRKALVGAGGVPPDAAGRLGRGCRQGLRQEMGQLSALVRATPDDAGRGVGAPQTIGSCSTPTAHPRIEPSWSWASRDEGRKAAVMKVAVVTAAMRSGERGGAEALYAGLVGGLRAAGHDVSALEIPIDESTFESVLASYARCYDVDASDFDVVISTKAPTYMVRHPRHVSYLLHTLRVFYDRFDARIRRRRVRRSGNSAALIHQLDKAALHPARVRGHFANGRTTFERLYDADSWWKQVPFKALHHPPALDGFRPPRPGEYVFLPGRLHRWKRADLVVRAMQRLKHDIPLLIAGTGEDEPRSGRRPTATRGFGSWARSATSTARSLRRGARRAVRSGAGGLRAHHDRGVQEPQAGDHVPRLRRDAAVREGWRQPASSSNRTNSALADRLAFLIDRPKTAARDGEARRPIRRAHQLGADRRGAPATRRRRHVAQPCPCDRSSRRLARPHRHRFATPRQR